MRVIILFMAICSLLVSGASCSWMGRTAGKGQAAVENSVDNLKEGYREGYHSEKGKTEPPKQQENKQINPNDAKIESAK